MQLFLTLCNPADHSLPRLLCPRDSSGKNTGMGCHFLLQGILLTQRSNQQLLALLLWLADSLPLAPPEKPQQYYNHFSHSVMSDSLQPHEPQHARPPCPSPTPGVYPNSCPLCQWCHPTISSSVAPFSSCPQSLPASGSFQMSQLFASGGQSIAEFQLQHQSFQWTRRTDLL